MTQTNTKLTKSQVTIIGAGPAGLQAAITLAENGVGVKLIEKHNTAGGHLAQWAHLFPDQRPASEVFQALKKGVDQHSLQVIFDKKVSSLSKRNGKWEVKSVDGFSCESDAVIMATGFNTFDAHQKEEYGYGVYPSVITSESLESVFKGEQGWPFNPEKKDLRFGIVHCVGSRDAKCGNLYCSKVCCVTAVKQAIELKKRFPQSEVYCFYMDMRMFGNGYEELYQEAQTKYNVQFIRGRLSEASPANQNRVQVKAEDTLLGRPLKLTLDMLVLMVGMVPACQSEIVNDKIFLRDSGFEASFMKPNDGFVSMNATPNEGLFLAGTCKGPATIPEVIQDGRSAAVEVVKYLKTKI